MIKTLRKKFIFSAMAAVTALIVVMLVAMNISNLVYTNSQINDKLDLLSSYGGERSNVASDTVPTDSGHSDSANKGRTDSSNDVHESVSDETASDGAAEETAGAGSDKDAEEIAGETVTLPGIDFIPVDTPDTPGQFIPAAELPSGYDNSDDVPEQAPDIDAFRRMSFFDDRGDQYAFMTSLFFTVRFDDNGNVVYANVEQIDSLEEEDAVSLAQEIYDSGKIRGSIGVYTYTVSENDFVSGETIIFLDTTEQSLGIFRTLIISLAAGIIAWLLMLAMIVFLSQRAILPIAQNMERQKQFVTNAGHELKTPLAIIQANAEALELFNGENKWTANIRAQVTRLTELTKNLLFMAKTDESTGNLVMENIDLSEVISSTAQTFEGPAQMKDIAVFNDIPSDVTYKGDKRLLTELFNLLFDNAVKYTNSGGQIHSSLVREGKHIVFTLQNTCEALPEAEPDKLFERFWRNDESHSQSGGHGIGLSAAKAIVQAHSGRISARYIGTASIEFTVVF